MIKKICLAVLTLVLAQSAFSGISLAQIPACGGGMAIWYFPDPIPQGWVCNIPGQGPYSMLCLVTPGKCPPVSWCPTCGKFVPSSGSPINLTNGNTYIQE